jgi:uncharacterized protein YndB with AHSA1/START domain
MTITASGDSVTAGVAVRRTVEVACSQAHAFNVFTERHGTWWPLQTHHIGAATAETVLIEPRTGGRWFERSIDGSECEWGRVLEWDPPRRIVLGWEITADWRHDSSLSTEVEIRFVALGPEMTRVELEHRQLERFGDKASLMQSIFESEGGWTGILERYAKVAGSIAPGAEVPCPSGNNR